MATPADTLTTIFDFAGPGPDGVARRIRMREEIPRLIKANNVEKWRTIMPTDALRLVERVAGPLLLTLGYPVVHPDIAGQPVRPAELAWLRMDRVARNLFTRNIPMMIRYRLEVLKAVQRSRSASSGKPHTSSV